jgi:hypothetical protein
VSGAGSLWTWPASRKAAQDTGAVCAVLEKLAGIERKR